MNRAHRFSFLTTIHLGDLNHTILTYSQTYATANTTTKQMQRMPPEQRRRHNRNQTHQR